MVGSTTTGVSWCEFFRGWRGVNAFRVCRRAVLFVDLKSEDTKNSKAPAVAVVCPLCRCRVVVLCSVLLCTTASLDPCHHQIPSIMPLKYTQRV